MLPEYEKYFCRDCIYFGIKCKRIDHDKIRFWKPYFSSYHYGELNSKICCEFIPKQGTLKEKEWPGFENYYYFYRQAWGECERPDYVTLALNNDFSVIYGVRYPIFAYGKRLDKNGNIVWDYRKYCIKTRKSPIGYRLIIEKSAGYDQKNNYKRG